MLHIVYSLLLVLLLVTPVFVTAAQSPLPLMLAKEMVRAVDLSQYWLSEKYDGVRAVWQDGQLLTRSGNLIAAPDWFLAALPEAAIEGELWLGRQRFDELSGLVRSTDSDDERWRQVKFMAFDMPGLAMPYTERMQVLDRLLADAPVNWLMPVPRFEVSDEQQLNNRLAEVVAAGGEGLMLNHKDALYEPVRTDAILKLKPKFDAEAEVLAYVPGKGKYQGMMGSLLVRTGEGRTFKIGTGFSDAERSQPPAIGDWVTFEYSGRTSTGLPRFPRFIRIYETL